MSSVSLCSAVGANTGKIKCDASRGIPKLLILGGSGYASSVYADYATLRTAILADINLANGNPAKLFPFPEIQNVTNNTEADTTGATGLGFQFILKEGKPAYVFAVLAGSTQEKQLRKFNNEIVPVRVLDHKKRLWGTTDLDDNFVGTDALIKVSGKPFSDGNSVENEYTNVRVSFLSAEDFFDNSAFIQTDFQMSHLEGLLNAELYAAAAIASNVMKIGVRVNSTDLNGSVNLFDQYATELASSPLWELKTGPTFSTPLALSNVAADNALKAFTVTADTTAFTALPSGTKIRARLKDPATLLAAGIRGIEGGYIDFTKP